MGLIRDFEVNGEKWNALEYYVGCYCAELGKA
jgi:hypothetical protein